MSTNTNDYSWADDIIAQFGNDFNPNSNSFVKADQLSDGEYGCSITKAELTQLQSTGEPIYKIILKIVDGPSHVGSLVEKATFFRNQVSVNILGAELKLLGIPTDQWKTRNISLAKGFSEAASVLAGMSVNVRKRTTPGKDGKSYHNISLIGLRVGDAVEPENDNPFAG